MCVLSSSALVQHSHLRLQYVRQLLHVGVRQVPQLRQQVSIGGRPVVAGDDATHDDSGRHHLEAAIGGNNFFPVMIEC